MFGGSGVAGFGSATASLFTGEPSVPVSTGGGGPPPPGADASTLDEPVSETVARDLRRIWSNLLLVVFPFADRSQQSAALRNWDLWGPMAFTLALAATLSLGTAKASATFSLVFVLVTAGAVALTVNAVLLGGAVGFFQALCLLGYCLFPLDAAALVSALVPHPAVRWVVVPAGVAWSSWASVPFIAGAVPPARRALAVYPLFLLNAAIGWLALVK